MSESEIKKNKNKRRKCMKDLKSTGKKETSEIYFRKNYCYNNNFRNDIPSIRLLTNLNIPSLSFPS